MNQKLAITGIDAVREVEPAIIEILAKLEDNTKAILRMNVFTAQALAAELNKIGG